MGVPYLQQMVSGVIYGASRRCLWRGRNVKLVRGAKWYNIEDGHRRVESRTLENRTHWRIFDEGVVVVVGSRLVLDSGAQARFSITSLRLIKHPSSWNPL